LERYFPAEPDDPNSSSLNPNQRKNAGGGPGFLFFGPMDLP